MFRDEIAKIERLNISEKDRQFLDESLEKNLLKNVPIYIGKKLLFMCIAENRKFRNKMRAYLLDKRKKS